mmetsp:Transcript_18871/g.48412  ORF Transcript_18871/g.48412 Transcript_18871/m.48412 type:complete len:232 (+) Transcript_18871:629-1324(+)
MARVQLLSQRVDVVEARGQLLRKAALQGLLVAALEARLVHGVRHVIGDGDHARVAVLLDHVEDRLLLHLIELEQAHLRVGLRVLLLDAAADVRELAANSSAHLVTAVRREHAVAHGHDVVRVELRELVALQERADRERLRGRGRGALQLARRCLRRYGHSREASSRQAEEAHGSNGHAAAGALGRLLAQQGLLIRGAAAHVLALGHLLCTGHRVRSVDTGVRVTSRSLKGA